jgi:hypothetical protein
VSPGERDSERAASPLRVALLAIDDPELARRLLGPDATAARCRVVFETMLPLREPTRLVAVLPHGLSITFASEDDEPTVMLVPWSRVAYVTAVQG